MTWTKSSRCDSTACLHVWPGCRTVWVRDSTGTVLVVERADWQALVATVTGRGTR